VWQVASLAIPAFRAASLNCRCKEYSCRWWRATTPVRGWGQSVADANHLLPGPLAAGFRPLALQRFRQVNVARADGEVLEVFFPGFAKMLFEAALQRPWERNDTVFARNRIWISMSSHKIERATAKSRIKLCPRWLRRA
jgi:hypothetical protein